MSAFRSPYGRPVTGRHRADGRDPVTGRRDVPTGPAGDAGSAVARTPAAAPPAPAGPVPVRVVVADDADGVRELICLLLDMEPDFTIVGRAANGAEAVDVVAETGPDLVLLDVAMPVLDGIAALPRIRRLVPGARVVVFTGFSAHTVREEAVALGADDVMEKGLGAGPLIDRLRAVCARSSPAG